MARIEYLRHKTQTAVPDDGSSDVGSDEWNGDAHNQVGILGFDNATKTLSTGAFVIADTLQIVAAESGTADDLDTITATDAAVNDFAIIRPDTGDTITVKHNTGNIQLPGGLDIVLDAANKPYLLLIYDGTNWKVPNIIGNALVDDNNNEILKFTKTASAVNEFTIKNSATGNAVEFQATGGDTNVSGKMVPKGTGEIYGALETMMIPLGDESTAHTAGVVYTIYAPYNFSITAVYQSCTVASSGTITLDILKAGTTIFSTKPTIVSSNTGSNGVLTTTPTTVSTGDKLEFKIDTADTGPTCAGAKLFVRFYRTS